MAELERRAIGLDAFAVREHRSLWKDAWRRLVSSNTARAGMAIVALFLLSAVLAHFFWPYNPKVDGDYSLKLKPPTLLPMGDPPSIHPFGTDINGRDIFRRVVHGGWNSLRVGLVAVGISLTVGGLLGLLAGFYESMPIGTLGRVALLGFVGGLLGAIPAWLAGQPYPALLLGALGVAAGNWDGFLKQEGANASLPRAAFFGVVGLLLAGLPVLTVGPAAAGVCGFLGLVTGVIVSLPLGGPLFSNVIMRLMDLILAFPGILLAIAIVTMLGPGLERAMIAIGIVGIPTYARLARAQVLSVIQEEYVTAARTIGAGQGRILFRHILPNTLSPIIVQATMGLAGAILWAGALGFLGLGAIPPEPEWGAMLSDGYKYLASGSWWAVLFPGLAIMLSVLGFNLLGDGLRDALDPRLRI